MALLGAAGGIGQPLGLLLKMNRLISELSLYDLAPFTKGVAKDLSHCNTNAKVCGKDLCIPAVRLCVYPAAVYNPHWQHMLQKDRCIHLDTKCAPIKHNLTCTCLLLLIITHSLNAPHPCACP